MVTVEANKPPSLPVVLQSVALNAGTIGNAEVENVIKATVVRNDPNLVFVTGILLVRGNDGKWSASGSV